MDKKNRFNVQEHTTLDGRIIDVFPISHTYIHELEQQVKKQKEVIDKINLIIKGIAYGENEDYYIEKINKINELLKEVSK